MASTPSTHADSHANPPVVQAEEPCFDMHAGNGVVEAHVFVKDDVHQGAFGELAGADVDNGDGADQGESHP